MQVGERCDKNKGNIFAHTYRLVLRRISRVGPPWLPPAVVPINRIGRPGALNSRHPSVAREISTPADGFVTTHHPDDGLVIGWTCLFTRHLLIHLDVGSYMGRLESFGRASKQRLLRCARVRSTPWVHTGREHAVVSCPSS